MEGRQSKRRLKSVNVYQEMSSRSWSDVRASSLARRSVNPIRQLVDGLQLEPNPEKQMIALSIGDPTIFGNLTPPESVADALTDSLTSQRYNGYAPSTGHEEARAAVARYASYRNFVVKPQDVILCSGCSSSLDMCISVLAERGQNILIPRPGFPLYQTLTEGLDIEARFYRLQLSTSENGGNIVDKSCTCARGQHFCHHMVALGLHAVNNVSKTDLLCQWKKPKLVEPENDWEVDLEDMESQIDENTAAIIVNNPSNPCGSVYSAEHLTNIIDIASRHCLPIIADEIYEHIVFEGEEFVPMASLSNDVPILSCSGLAKRFLVPGWRMGWIIIHDRNQIFKKEIRVGLQKFSQRTIGSSTLIQGALSKILHKTPEKFFDETISVLERNALLLYSYLSRIKGLKPLMPKGAMYMMVNIELRKFPEFKNGLEFVTTLVSEQSCFCLPGECFGAPGYIRVTLSPPREMLEEACDRIREFCEQHYTEDISLNIYEAMEEN